MKRTAVAVLAAITVLAALGRPVQASVLTFSFSEVGGNVVGTVSGTINTDALSKEVINYSDGGAVWSQGGVVAVGPTHAFWRWSGLDSIRPSRFGDGMFYCADNGAGDTVAANLYQGGLYVSPTYVSGSVLSGTSTWNGRDLKSMDLLPGTYTATYNGGLDSVVVQVGAVPEPATVGVLVLGGIAALARRRRNAAA